MPSTLGPLEALGYRHMMYVPYTCLVVLLHCRIAIAEAVLDAALQIACNRPSALGPLEALDT